MIYPKIINNLSYILNKKTSIGIKIFIGLLVINIILILIISNFYEYKKIISYLGYVKLDNKYYVLTYIENNEVNDIVKSNTCNNKSFKVININNNYILDNKKVSLVTIEIELEPSDLIDNNIIELNFNLGKTTIIKELRKEFKKWKN